MKIQKNIEIPEKIIIRQKQNKIIEKTICDIDKQEDALYKCVCCGRDICREHTRVAYDRLSDYPEYYCIFCYYLLFKKYKKSIEDLEKKQELETEELYNNIKKESLEIKELSDK